MAGGMESMTNAPHLMTKSREGYKYGDVTVRDHMAFDGLWDVFTDQAMGGLTDSRNEDVEQLTREEQDAFSARSHQRAAAAWKNGVFERRGGAGRGAAASWRPGRRQRGRGCPWRHHGRVAESAAPGLLGRRHDHRRFGVPDLRRCVRRGRDEQGQGRGTRTDAGWPRSVRTARSPAPTRRCSRNRPRRSSGPAPGRGSSSATSIWSSSTKLSLPSGIASARELAIERGRRSTSTAGRSRWDTRSVCRAPGSCCTWRWSCSAAVAVRVQPRCVVVAAKGDALIVTVPSS